MEAFGVMIMEKIKVPFFDLKRQYERIRDELEEKVTDTMRSSQYVEGPATKELEKELTNYIGVKHVITCGNGTDSLRIALQANGIKREDEIITTAFSFFATAEAIAQVGAVPVFADVRLDNFNIDVEDIRRKTTDKTAAILVVHIFGMPADMEEINELAEELGIPVIEDACQAIGAEYRGKKTGTLGTMGCFSFYPTKNLGAFGDGGMITTNDDALAENCRALKNHAAGRIGAKAFCNLYQEEVRELEQMPAGGDSLYDPCKYYNYFIGGNSRLDSIQAAVLSVKLKYLDSYNEKRAAIARRYSQELSGLPIIVPDITEKDRKSCWHQYAVLCDRKEELIQYLEEHGIGAGSFYPVPLHLQKAFKDLGYRPGDLKVAEHICSRSVCLPVFPELEEKEQDYVIQTIRNFFE